VNASELTQGWVKVSRRSSLPLVVWFHPKHGKYPDGLFAMHDQEGFSLADSLIQCNRLGWEPCLGQFRADALRAGWSRAKIEQVISGALADSASMGIVKGTP
jgi:hypothetical protein